MQQQVLWRHNKVDHGTASSSSRCRRPLSRADVHNEESSYCRRRQWNQPMILSSTSWYNIYAVYMYVFHLLVFPGAVEPYSSSPLPGQLGGGHHFNNVAMTRRSQFHPVLIRTFLVTEGSYYSSKESTWWCLC